MKKCYKILFSVALAPIMSLLFVALLFSAKNNIMALLIMTHIATIAGTRLLVKKNYCHPGALLTGFALIIFVFCAYEYNTGSDSDILKYFWTFIITFFYALPALLFVLIYIVLTEK